MSPIVPENVSYAHNSTDAAADDRSNVTMTSPETTAITETVSTAVTETKTKPVTGTTTIENKGTHFTEQNKTTTTVRPSTKTNNVHTKTTTKEQIGTTTSEVTTTASSTTIGVFTEVTSTRVSHPVIQKSTTIRRTTNDNISTKFPSSNATLNSSVSTMAVSTNVDGSAMVVKRISDDCTETIAIVSGVCAGLVLLTLLGSVLCFYRLRHKWRAKVQLERKKTDIWSMATYNNTIINENFSDYQLASTTNKQNRKASKFSEDSIHFYDPFSETVSQSRFASNHDDIVLRNETLSPETRADYSTLRRNTVSAPEELDTKLHALRVEPDYLELNEDRNTLRGRSSTFTVGRKNNIDRHVLLSHEELVDDQSVVGIAQTGPKYNARTNSYHITEL